MSARDPDVIPGYIVHDERTVFVGADERAPYVIHAPNADGTGAACGADAKPDGSGSGVRKVGHVPTLVGREDRE